MLPNKVMYIINAVKKKVLKLVVMLDNPMACHINTTLSLKLNMTLTKDSSLIIGFAFTVIQSLIIF